VSSLRNRTAAAHQRASAVFGDQESRWILDGIHFIGTLGPGVEERRTDDDSAVRGGPRNQQKTPGNPWLSAEKSLFPKPGKFKKGDIITKEGSSEKYRIVDIRNIENDPLINFQINL
jgi:hypothetical protein